MAIKEKRPISMAEVTALVGDSEKALSIKRFIKNFSKISAEKAIELQKELEALDLIKLKDYHIVKIVDFLPQDASELNKVASDISLDTEEIAKIVDVVKKY
jgi:DNA-directed RNA polymerase subunit F